MNDNILTIKQLNDLIKSKLENDYLFNNISIKGEISNFTRNISGHLYFTLKDTDSQIKAVMFKGKTFGLKFNPQDGMKVVVTGNISVYIPNGTYQIIVNSIQQEGIGNLYLMFEELKNKLKNEGLFDENHKKQIPRFPNKIGVITSNSGAAVRDIINITRRRYPIAKIIIYPAIVQGDGAENSLINGLEYFENNNSVDVIIIGRGGGSIEDLWCFNSEKLARKIYDAKTPIISAVGHEIDFTICDFVSDLRAPTPSAAAEICCPDSKELLLKLDELEEKVNKHIDKLLEQYEQKIKLYSKAVSLDRVLNLISLRNSDLIIQKQKIDSIINNMIIKYSGEIEKYMSSLSALNPDSVLKRGYSILYKEGKVVTNIDQIKEDDIVNIKLSEGEVISKVLEKK